MNNVPLPDQKPSQLSTTKSTLSHHKTPLLFILAGLLFGVFVIGVYVLRITNAHPSLQQLSPTPSIVQQPSSLSTNTSAIKVFDFNSFTMTLNSAIYPDTKLTFNDCSKLYQLPLDGSSQKLLTDTGDNLNELAYFPQSNALYIQLTGYQKKKGGWSFVDMILTEGSTNAQVITRPIFEKRTYSINDYSTIIKNLTTPDFIYTTTQPSEELQINKFNFITGSTQQIGKLAHSPIKIGGCWETMGEPEGVTPSCMQMNPTAPDYLLPSFDGSLLLTVNTSGLQIANTAIISRNGSKVYPIDYIRNANTQWTIWLDNTHLLGDDGNTGVETNTQYSPAWKLYTMQLNGTVITKSFSVPSSIEGSKVYQQLYSSPKRLLAMEEQDSGILYNVDTQKIEKLDGEPLAWNKDGNLLLLRSRVSNMVRNKFGVDQPQTTTILKLYNADTGKATQIATFVPKDFEQKLSSGDFCGTNFTEFTIR